MGSPNIMLQWLSAAVGFLCGGGVAGFVSHFNPLWTAGGAFATGFIAKVWAKLEPRYVDGCADWCDGLLRDFFSGYYRYDVKQLVFLHRNFNVKGLSDQGPHAIELEHVFVELSLHPNRWLKRAAIPRQNYRKN